MWKHTIKNDNGNLKFDLLSVFLRNKNVFEVEDAMDANRFKTSAETTLMLVASPKHQ